ncbi:hypothetical protein [Streptomyces sp. NPDC056361]|uniref:hypothetical protein n=1 Tax=Streptomyces sp. NPDC056361 TaxID=3345795 RepID=UPI0035E1FD09
MAEGDAGEGFGAEHVRGTHEPLVGIPPRAAVAAEARRAASVPARAAGRAAVGLGYAPRVPGLSTAA